MSVTLVLAAVVAGLATFLSPCVLPIVPVVLATGTTGGRRRPLGVALGLALAFVAFTLAASRVLAALGLPQDLLHTVAVVLLAFVGADAARAAARRVGGEAVPAARARARAAGSREEMDSRRASCWEPPSRSSGRPAQGRSSRP